MSRPKLKQLLRTHAIFTASYYLTNAFFVEDAIAALRRKFPELHYQTLRGLVLRVAKAQAAGYLLTSGSEDIETLRRSIPRFEGWESADPELEGKTYYYDVILELKTKGGKKSHFRTVRLGSDELLSKEELKEMARQLLMQDETKREGLSPPIAQKFNRLIEARVNMVWRS
jgi:hypothetical protein